MNTIEVAQYRYWKAQAAYLKAHEEMKAMDRKFGGTDNQEDLRKLIIARASVYAPRKAYEEAGRELDRVTFGS